MHFIQSFILVLSCNSYTVKSMRHIDLLPTVARLSLHPHPLDVQVGGNKLQLPLSFQGTGLE